MIKTGTSSSGKPGYALEPAMQQGPTPPDPSSQPVSRQDILNLQEALVWPPKEMRDINLMEMDNQRHALNDTWNDPSLDPTSKLIKAGYHSQMFALANKKHFSRGSPGEAFLPGTYRTPPPVTPAQEWRMSSIPADKDLKQTASLIPRYRGQPMSAERSLLHVPGHLKDKGMDLVMTLLSPDSGISWDSQGKLVDTTQGRHGRVMQGTNIQELISYALSPDPLSPPPSAYSKFREAVMNAGKKALLSPLSETAFNIRRKQHSVKSLRRKLPSTPGYMSSTPKRGTTVKPSKLLWGKPE